MSWIRTNWTHLLFASLSLSLNLTHYTKLCHNPNSFLWIWEKYIWISTFTFRKLYLLWICRNNTSLIMEQRKYCFSTRTYMLNFMNWIHEFILSAKCACAQCTKRLSSIWAKTFFSMWHYDPLWPILLCYVIEYVYMFYPFLLRHGVRYGIRLHLDGNSYVSPAVRSHQDKK